ncbi:hypothetical protein P7C71_g6445, partial [Lecanoromycetidae sp. Uapishka_2]
MSTVGPELPPHLQAKRKREDETFNNTPKRRRSSSTSSNDAKLRRVIGPAPPPASLAELPPTAPDPNVDSDSSDDDFGPSLPPAPGSTKQIEETRRQQRFEEEAAAREAAKKPQREEWMLVPPKSDDWSARVDPTKLKNRKFQTGKGSKAPAGKSGGDALWTETPEQKRQRLEDEMMGVKKPAQLGPEDKKDARQMEEARETERRIREYNERNRNTSLYAEHKKAVPKEKEDDPSARAFDKEKDIGLGMKVGHAQKKEMLNRAKDFGSRFAGGNYL